MPNTYYVAQGLDGEQIEAALTAIDGVVSQENNGKVLAIENGKIVAKSASEWTDTPVLEAVTITENGTYDPDDDNVDGYSIVTVNVPSEIKAEDEGKVVSNGVLVAQTAITVSANGTYNTTTNSSVTVNVQSGSGAVVQPLNVTQNGTYNPPSGVDGYTPVTVNVQDGVLPDGDEVSY